MRMIVLRRMFEKRSTNDSELYSHRVHTDLTLEIRKCSGEPILPAHLRLPAEMLLCKRDIGLPDLRIVLRQFLEYDFAFRSGELSNFFSKLQDRNFIRIADVDGICHGGDQQSINSL